MSKLAKWKQLTEEEFAQKVKESHSFYELAEKIGYSKSGGGTQKMLKNAVKEKGLDTSHFTGQGWNKNNYNYSTFTKNSNKKNGKTTLNAIINLRGRQCEQCGMTEWFNRPINLEIHHIDGNHYNNELDNIQLLCPNCHSYTENYCGKNINSGKTKVEEEDFVRTLEESNNISQALKRLGLSLGSGNYNRANELIIKYQIIKFLKKSTQNNESAE